MNDQGKEHQTPLEPQKAKNLYESQLVDALFDLNIFSQEQMLKGLNNRECFLLSQLKNKINKLLVDLDIFNCFTIYTKIPSKVFIDFKPPEIRLSFHPATIEKSTDSLERIEELNTKNGLLIQNINALLAQKIQTSNRTIRDIHLGSSDKTDGFLLTLSFDQYRNISLKEVVDKLLAFSLDVQYSSPNELIITQQFSNFFKIEYESPYFLCTLSDEMKKSLMEQKNKIHISIHNTNVNVPYKFLSTAISKIIFDIEKKSNNNPNPPNLSMYEQLDLINETTVLVNLDIRHTPIKEEK